MMKKMFFIMFFGFAMQVESATIVVEPISVETNLYSDIYLDENFQVRNGNPHTAANTFIFSVSAVNGDVYLPYEAVDYRIVSNSGISFEAVSLVSSGDVESVFDPVTGLTWSFVVKNGHSETFTFNLDYQQERDGVSFVEVDAIRFGEHLGQSDNVSDWNEWGGMHSDFVWLEGQKIPEPSFLLLLPLVLLGLRRHR